MRHCDGLREEWFLKMLEIGIRDWRKAAEAVVLEERGYDSGGGTG